jgi:hypothetical protein
MLEGLLETASEHLPPEQKMDALYSTILATCHWDDAYFAKGYQQVMGGIVVGEIPLTSNALQAVYGPEPRVGVILSRLASLITGVTHAVYPLRIPHISFREFITLRAPSPYHICTTEHSAQLARLCLRILGDIFASEIAGTSYLSKNADLKSELGIPEVMVDRITEGEWYAIRFWHAHIVKLAKPVENEVVVALHTFLSLHLITWVEVLISKWPYQPLTSVRRWIKVRVDHFYHVESTMRNEHV